MDRLMDRNFEDFQSKKDYQNHVDAENHNQGHMKKKSVVKVRTTLGYSKLSDDRLGSRKES